MNGQMVKNVLRQPRSWRPIKVQCPRVTSQMRPGQALHTQRVLKSPLETPEPHVRGGTLMLHTIELITGTCHDARLYFLLMGLEASFVKRLARLTQLVSHRSLTHTEDPRLSTNTKWLVQDSSFHVDCNFDAKLGSKTWKYRSTKKLRKPRLPTHSGLNNSKRSSLVNCISTNPKCRSDHHRLVCNHSLVLVPRYLLFVIARSWAP